MTLQKSVIKVLPLLFMVLFIAAECRAQVDSVRDYRIRMKTYSFDPLDSLRQLDIPENLIKQPQPGEPSHQIIQFKRSLTRKEREMLQKEFGLKLDEYIPNKAFLEKVDSATIEKLKTTELFRSNTYYQPAFKISPGIGTLEFRTPERQAIPELMLRAKLFDDADTALVKIEMQNIGATDIKIIDDREIKGSIYVLFKLHSTDLLPDIALVDGVKWIEEIPEYFRDNGNTAGTIQSGIPGTTPIWDQGINGENQIIGILDSPVDTGHCMFNDPIDNTIRSDHRKVVGYRNGRNEALGTHGTFTAGIAAGDDFNNPGTGGNRGIAWAARLTYGNDWDIPSLRSMLSALTAAKNDGAFIHSNSWHNEPNPQYNQTAEDVDNFIWNNEDHVVIGSSGNGPGLGESVGPPGTAKNAICVSATDRDPNEMNHGDGCDGPTADGRRKPEVTSTGCGITSSEVNTNCTITTAQNIYGAANPICASSWATPAASACATLIRQYYIEGWYPTGTKQPHNSFTPSGALIKATLLNSTINMTGIAGYPSNREGWGLERLDDALFFAGDARNVWVWDVRNKNGLATGESNNYALEVVNNAEPLKITLVWTEPPASSGSTDPSVNDLDLAVVDPNNNTFLGNHFVGGQSATGGAVDDLNNVEMVLINTPDVGEYTIQINGTEVNQGNPGQGYALVATADTPEPPEPVGPQNTLVVRTGVPGIAGGVAPPLTTVQNIMTDAINYIDDASYGEVTINPTYAEVTLDNPSTFYYSSSNNVLIEMTEDVIDKLIDANPNTFDNGTAITTDDVDRMMIVLNDQDFTDDYATTGPWPYDIPGGITRRISVSVNSRYNDPEERFGHALGHHFGLVDLYAHPNVTFAMPHVDDWDNMAKPFNGSDFMAWSKARATWITEHGSNIIYIPRPDAGVPYDQTHGINFVSSTNQDNKAIAIGMTEDVANIEDEDVFYFVEAREKTNTGEPDDNIPMTGVLLYYVNENIPQGEGPVRIIDKTVGTPLADNAAYVVNDSKTLDGRGLEMEVNTGTGGADYDIRIKYDPPETDNDVNIRKGDPTYISPDIWIDSQKDGFDEDMGRTPQDRGDRPVTGEVNRVYVRVYNPGPGDAYDFTIYVRMSEPYHTVGGEADFNKAVGEIYIPKLEPANSPFIDYVEWIPDDDIDPHSCAWVSIPNVFNDVNELNNTAQQNLKEVSSSHSSPYDEVTYNFGFSNPEDTKELFYFRVEGIPDDWTVQLNPPKAYLNGNERIECTLKVKPPDDAPVCTEHRISITSWMARGHTLVPIGGGAVQVDLRNRTNLTITAELSDCTKKHIYKPDVRDDLAHMVAYVEKQACIVIETEGCTNPPRPYEEIIVRYEHPDGYPIYRTVITDEFGCYADELVVAEGGQWEVSTEYPGNDCDGPAFVNTEITVGLPQTHDQDGDNVDDKDEPQGDHDKDGLIGIYDPDCDNDGIDDGNEPLGDCDRDGHNNIVDADSDNDGVIDGLDPDPYEVCRPPFRKYSLSAHLGTAIPSGTFSNNYDPGFNILLDFDYHFTRTWSAVGLLGYNEFKAKTAGADNIYWINVSGNVRYHQPISPPLRLYVGGGPGLYIPEVGDKEFGANVGLGLDYNYSNFLTFEMGTDYHAIFDPDLQFTHIHIGIIFKF